MKTLTILVLTLTLIGCTGVNDQLIQTSLDIGYQIAVAYQLERGECIPLQIKDVYNSLLQLKLDIEANKGEMTLSDLINLTKPLYQNSIDNKLPLYIQIGLKALLDSLVELGDSNDVLRFNLDDKAIEIFNANIISLGKAIELVDQYSGWCK